MDIVNYEYGVHLPDVNMISCLIEKSVEIHFKNIDNKTKDPNIPK